MNQAADLRLHPGARVAIIGGGPAGSFFALHLMRFARQALLPLSVTIFERREFEKRGPAGCNRCAGILSARLVQKLEDLGLCLPAQAIMAEVESYVLHLAGEEIEIARPDRRHSIISVYRGGGPLHGGLPPDVSFDAWLLGQAAAAGADVQRGLVQSLSAGDRMTIEVQGRQEQFDLVAWAGGVNARPPALTGLAYGPPETRVMAQDELALDGPFTQAERHRIQVYLGQQASLLFAALIPKGDFFNISLLVRRSSQDAVGEFLGLALCQRWGAGVRRLCGCHPRIAVSPARAPFADRFVAVGDAGVTRLYKGGITTAFLTARQAAWTAVHRGISRQAFGLGCGPLYGSVHLDNRMGAFLFWLWQQSEVFPAWGRALAQVLLGEQALPARERHGHRAVWGMLTGDDSYTHIGYHFLHPKILAAFAAAWLTPASSGSSPAFSRDPSNGREPQ